MKILDATCGARSIWYQKNHPFTTYMDIRNEDIDTIEPGNKAVCQRKWKVRPDIVADFRDTPFEDNTFDLIVFDPPHIVRDNNRKPSIMEKKYGYLPTGEYKQILKAGFQELFRILKPNGVFILKWAECDKKIDEILRYIPYQPLFGTRTGQKNNNHWILFIKHSQNGTLSSYGTGGQ